MKKTTLYFFTLVFVFISLLNSVSAAPTNMSGTFTASWDSVSNKGKIVVTPSVGSAVTFWCDPNGSWVEKFNYNGYWNTFSTKYSEGETNVQLEYATYLGAGNLIVNTPSFW